MARRLASKPPSRAAIVGVVNAARPFLLEARRLFRTKANQTRTPSGAWREFVYCILAGSQVPVESARAASNGLLEAFGRRCYPWEHGAELQGRRAARRIEAVVSRAGYRFPRQKAMTIVSARAFVRDELAGDLRRIRSQPTAAQAAAHIASHVQGVGPKIANHFLRNMGMDTSTVDVHLFRLVGRFEGRELPATTAEFEYVQTVIREAADRLHVNVSVAQFAAWLAARGHFQGVSYVGRPPLIRPSAPRQLQLKL